MAPTFNNPPPNTPRIVSVLEPATGHYVVKVRVDATTFGRFPDKPFGTPIGDIGLIGSDASKYPGYTLVSVEPFSPMSEDLLWTFQNLTASPSWSTLSAGQENMVPGEFRRQVITTTTKQDVPPSTTPSAIVGNLASSTVQQQENTGKAVRIDVTEEVNSDIGPLIGQRAYVEKVVATVEKTLGPTDTDGFTDALAVDSGLFVIESGLNPLGNGLSTRETVKYVPPEGEEAWPVLHGGSWDPELSSFIGRTEQYVGPSDAYGGEGVTITPVNVDRSLLTVEQIPHDALASYEMSFPTRVNLDLPRELISAEVAWVESGDVGTDASDGSASGTSISLSQSSDVHSSKSMIPELVMNIREVWAKDLPAQGHFFYLPLPVNESDILGRVGADAWPVFQPAGCNILLSGIKLAVNNKLSLSVTASPSSISRSQSAGSSADIQHSINSVYIPPTLHNSFSLGDSLRVVEVTATGSLNAAVASAALAATASLGGGVAINRTTTRKANATIFPVSIPATAPTAIPRRGLFLLTSKVEPTKWSGWCRVYAETFDAANIPP